MKCCDVKSSKQTSRPIGQADASRIVKQLAYVRLHVDAGSTYVHSIMSFNARRNLANLSKSIQDTSQRVRLLSSRGDHVIPQPYLEKLAMLPEMTEGENRQEQQRIENSIEILEELKKLTGQYEKFVKQKRKVIKER